MKLSSSHSQLLESSNFLLIPSHHHRNNNTAVVVTRMLSSHCDNVVLQPYAPPVGRRAAVLLDHRRYRPNVVEVAPSCPRCDSPNTKFCYYNNYSLSQPRYFCKGCRRYWTKGGSLRNVPVGGGCRKSRRGKPVVRAVAVDAAPVAAASGGGAASAAAASAHPSSSSSPATLRPDLLLDGMVGSPVGLCQPTDADAAENPAAATEGSTIDLALLYAKFLNHQPAAERCAAAAVPESLDALSVSSSGDDVSPVVVVPPRDHQPFTTQDGGFGDLSATTASAEPSTAAAAPPQCPDDACAEALVGAFSVDPRCYDSLGLTPDGGDLVLPSTWHLGAKYEPLDPLPEDAMSLQDGFAGDEDDVWSSALACQGLEAALCRP